MKILLTGCDGQLGRCFLDRMPDTWEVLATDYKEFDITFLNKIRSDSFCYDLFYLDQIIRNSLKLSQSEMISDSDYENAIKLNFSYKKEIINQNPFEYLYGQDFKKARDEFEKIYFQHHIKNYKICAL